MACMEHMCAGCGWLEFDNEFKRTLPCHKCGCTRWVSTWDEANDRHEEEKDGEDDAGDTD